jgi:hypothetical protein
MNDEEFLARWSRRKREAKTTVELQPPAAATEAPNPTAQDARENPDNAEVDLSSLPPIESIVEGTDITAFLRKGIPAELSRAALRRAWAADPAIRDFIGLAENAWDFNDPNAMPGFGPLDCSEEQLATLVDRVMGGVRNAAESLANAIPEQAVPAPNDACQSADREPLSEYAQHAVTDVGRAEAISLDEAPPSPAAVQPDAPENLEDDRLLARRRTHGSALPR